MILGSTAIATWIAKLAFIALLLIPLALGLISLGWYVAVIVLLYRIWHKVRHLPG